MTKLKSSIVKRVQSRTNSMMRKTAGSSYGRNKKYAMDRLYRNLAAKRLKLKKKGLPLDSV